MFWVVKLHFRKYLPHIVLLFLLVPAIMYLYNFTQSRAVPAAELQESCRPTLVIDAGHGGMDGGASAPWGEPESEINLNIALRLRTLCELYGVPFVMTRESNEIDYPPAAGTVSAKKAYDTKMRLKLIHSVPDALLLSIHQNEFSEASPRGAQALYGEGEESRGFGELLQDNLLGLWSENKRAAARISDSIYLMRNAECPAVLVECGFLSNPEEAALLQRDDYRLKIAAVLMGSYLQHTADGSNI